MNEECSIRIDERAENELYEAINYLKENPDKCGEMAQAALEKARTLTIEHRARAIKKVLFGQEK